MDNFVAWLNAEMEKRGWSLQLVAGRIGVSHTAMANIANGCTRPSADVCQRIALVFHVPPEEVFRRAGLLPPDLREMTVLREVAHFLRQLSPEQQDATLTFVRTLVEGREGSRLREAHAGVVSPS